jgi:hypothetical protein
MKKLIIVLLALFTLIAASAVSAYDELGTKPGDAYAGGQLLYSLPVLDYEGNADACDTSIAVQNLNTVPVKATLIVWGEAGFCAPQSTGPLKVECTGLLPPGATWTFTGNQLPSGSFSGMVLVSADGITDNSDISQDAMCENLFFGVVGDADDYRRFMLGYGNSYYSPWGLYWKDQYKLGVKVLRDCPADQTAGVHVTSSYNGIENSVEQGSTFTTLVPLVYASKAGFNSWIYIQNKGLQCTSVEIGFKAQDDCLRNKICEVVNLAPGETYAYDASQCVGPEWIGSAWLRSTQPVGVAVDIVGKDILQTYEVGPTNEMFDDNVLITAFPGNEMEGWDNSVQIASLQGGYAKVVFIDGNGRVIKTLVDYICPQGSQTFFLPLLHNLPGQNAVQAIAYTLDGSKTFGIANAIKYSDAQRTQTTEGMAYNMFNYKEVYGDGKYLASPLALKDPDGTGITTEFLIANPSISPNTNSIDMHFYDQNGYLSSVWEYLNEKSSEYIDLQDWGWINEGYKGSVLFEDTYGLYGYGYERSKTMLGQDIPGDETAGSAMWIYDSDIGPQIYRPELLETQTGNSGGAGLGAGWYQSWGSSLTALGVANGVDAASGHAGSSFFEVQ